MKWTTVSAILPTTDHLSPIHSFTVDSFHYPTGLPTLRTYTAEALDFVNNGTALTQPGVNSTMSLLRNSLKKCYLEAGDIVWKENLEKGCKLLYQMDVTDHDAGQTFTVKMDSAASTLLEYPKSFLDWGYSPDKTGILNWFEFEEGGSPIRPALKALKIKDDLAESNSVVGWVHDRVTQHNGETYKATGAKCFTVANAFDGMILGWWKYSPFSQASEQKPPLDPSDPLPDLKGWSDVAYMVWAAECLKKSEPVSNLRYIFSSPVENAESQGNIARAMKTTMKSPLWPGRKEYSMDRDEGKAILASPNGRGAALLLIQHKVQLGERITIEKAAVFREGEETNLLFYVRKPDQAQGQKKRK